AWRFAASQVNNTSPQLRCEVPSHIWLLRKSRAHGNDYAVLLKQSRMLPPECNLRKRVGTHDEVKRRIRIHALQSAKRLDRIRTRRRFQLNRRHQQARSVCSRESDHRISMIRRADLLIALVWGHIGRNKEQPIEVESVDKRFGNAQMTYVQRVERSAVHSDPLAGHFPAPQRSGPLIIISWSGRGQTQDPNSHLLLALPPHEPLRDASQ